jgi:hypothetical protein
MDIRATHVTGGVVGAAWGTAEIGEAGHEEVTKGRTVGPPGLVVGPPTSVPWAV